jgi:glycosyltransferase involved in cell wall biosynthesis
MKVLHVIPSVGEMRGGTSRAVLELAKAQQALEIDLNIVTTNDNGPDLLAVPVRQLTNFEQVPILFFPRFSPAIPPIREFAFSRSLTTWLWQHLCDYDLVHVHALFSYASTLAMMVARIRQVPYVTTLHGLLGKWPLQQSARKKKLYLTLIERANLNAAKVLHVTSEWEKNETAELKLRPPTVVIPHGLTPVPVVPNARQRLREQFNLGLDEPIVLFLARLHPVKGLEYLIPALGQIADQRFTFILAGSGDPEYEQVVERLLTDYGIRKRTYTVGFVRDEMKALLLEGADLFVLPSHSENFGISALEALACGVPVLLTPGVPLSPLVQRHNFGYVAELSVSSIVSAIQYFFEHRDEAKVMGQRAHRFVQEQYRWEIIASKLCEVYHSVLYHTPVSSAVL